MLNFIKHKYKRNKDHSITVYYDFQLPSAESDLMIRGGAFYAVWVEPLGLWCRDESTALRLFDKELWSYVDELKEKFGPDTVYDVKTIVDFSSGKLIEWKRFLKCNPDIYVDLDSFVTFKSQEVKKTDYVSKRLTYDLSNGPTPNYDLIMSTLYGLSRTKRFGSLWASAIKPPRPSCI